MSTLPSDMPVISHLELHVTHACNLACESCSHYSDHGHVGNVALDQADRWMSLWSDRVAIRRFVLLGGEPTIHPDLSEFVYLVRKHWPETEIIIITNGFFLDRHPNLPKALTDCAPARLILSVHHHSTRYNARIAPILALVEAWRLDYSLSVDVRPAYKYWTRRYEGFGSEMAPFEDGNARQSWEICPAKYCKQLYDGMLWKCSPITYLQLQNAKFNLSPKWDRYLNYRPLSSDCDDETIRQFIAKDVEDICLMCSAEKREFQLPDPLIRSHLSTSGRQTYAAKHQVAE